VIDTTLKITNKKKKGKTTTPKIKWWTLKDPVIREKFKKEVLENINKNEKDNDLWKSCSTVLRESGQKFLEKITGKLPPQTKKLGDGMKKRRKHKEKERCEEKMGPNRKSRGQR